MNPIDLRPRTDGGVVLDSIAPPAAPATPAEPVLAAPLVEAPARSRTARLLGGRLWPRLLLVVDLVALIAGVAIAIRWPGEQVAIGSAWPLLLLPAGATAMLAMRGMYERRLRMAVIDNFAPVAGALSTTAMALVLLDTYVAGGQLPPAVYVHAWAVTMVLVSAGRAVTLLIQRRMRVTGAASSSALIVGAGHVGARIARRLLEAPEYGLRPVGFLDDQPIQAGIDAAGVRVLGTPSDLEWIAQLTRADHVVLAFSTHPDEQLVDLVRRCDRNGLEVLLVPRLFDSLNNRATYEPLGGLPLQRLKSVSPRGWLFAVKHGFDRIAAAALLVIGSPLLLAIALAVKLTSPGPVLFRQQRVGRDGRRFDLLKFRSMAPAAPDERFHPRNGAAPGGIEGGDRRTLVGRILRRFSLDELPQLINVVRGHMSLVGPRPERPEFVDLFSTDVSRYVDRHRVKSGITGWAQVNGLRGQTSLADRVEWDNYYIEHWSLGLDLKVLALTLVAVFRAAE